METNIKFHFIFVIFTIESVRCYEYQNVYSYGQYSYEGTPLSDDCEKVNDLLNLMAVKSRDNSYVLQVVGAFLGYTGFDPRIRTQREEVACLIADIRDLHDVSVIFHLPDFYVEELYTEFLDQWNRTGGVQGVREKFMVSLMLANWIQDSGYPSVPLDESFEDLSDWFHEIADLSRPAVLKLVSRPALPIDWPPDQLARAISESNTFAELAVNLNTTRKELIKFEHNKQNFMQRASGLEIHLKTAQLIEDLGFLRLQ